MKVRGLVLLFLLAAPVFGHTQDTLPPVVVTSTRLRDIEQPATQVPGKVIAITAEEIEQLGATTIQEVLQYQTGVVMYDSIGNASQQTIDLRGFNAQPVTATSVFVDGVRINEPDFNTINFDLIPLEDVERIEIMPGTATVFGRNALGGVINITTKRGRKDQPHFGVDMGGGSFGRQQYTFRTDGPLPFANLDYYLGVTRELIQGFREASGERATRILSKLGFKPNDSTDATLAYTRVTDHLKQAGSLQASRLRIDRNDNESPGDFYDGNLHFLAGNLRQKLPAGFSLALNGFFRSNDLDTFVNFDRGDGLCTGCNSRLFTKIRSGGTTAQLSHNSAPLAQKNLISLGAEYNRNNYSIKNSGDFFGPFLNKQSTTEDVAGVYLTDTLTLFNQLAINAAVRYDWDHFDFTDNVVASQSGIKHFSRWSPKAGVVYTPFQELSLSFNYSQGVRMPTVSEIFAQGPFGSNPNLQPMTSQTFEVGAKAQPVSWLEGSVVYFYTPVKDEIFFTVTDPIFFTGLNNNIKRTLRQGVEVSAKSRWGKLLDGFFNYSYTKATFETDVLLFSGLARKGDELPLVPRHRVSAGINWHPRDGLTLSLIGNYVGKQFMLNDEPNNAQRLADYFLLNTRIAYTWKNWTAEIAVNNLTDHKYSTYGVLGATQPSLVPAPGINAVAGVSFRY
jgi:outer membrane receptor protein involved in Fe transport